jgi:hypothetical protein
MNPQGEFSGPNWIIIDPITGVLTIKDFAPDISTTIKVAVSVISTGFILARDL